MDLYIGAMYWSILLYPRYRYLNQSFYIYLKYVRLKQYWRYKDNGDIE